MEKIINYENLRSFAYSNDKLIKGEIKGIVVDFFGLGGMSMYNDDSGVALEYAEKNILFLVPYYNPWSWMNKQAVDYTDEIISVLCEQYGLGDSVKVVSTGGSMGGLSALVYCAYAKITPCACVTNCPVCDLVYHFGERPDLPRTIYSAFYEYEGSMEDALKSCSPLHLVGKLPKIPYTVLHCERDKAVNLEIHSEKFVNAMKNASYDISLERVPKRSHCDLTPEARISYNNAILNALK